jgi:hypothetical protein
LLYPFNTVRKPGWWPRKGVPYICTKPMSRNGGILGTRITIDPKTKNLMIERLTFVTHMLRLVLTQAAPVKVTLEGLVAVREKVLAEYSTYLQKPSFRRRWKTEGGQRGPEDQTTRYPRVVSRSFGAERFLLGRQPPGNRLPDICLPLWLYSNTTAKERTGLSLQYN